jgi:hypothetical protein
MVSLFGVNYVLVDDAALFKLILTLKEYYGKSVMYVHIGEH